MPGLWPRPPAPPPRRGTMSELQATVEFSVELCKFYNVDLFQRGLYQVRCGLRVPPKQPVQTEVSVPETGKTLGTASVLGNGGACRPFQILYRNEEVSLQDMILFRCHMLVDSRRLRESLERAEFSLVIELWFCEQPHAAMMMVSTRTLHLNFSPSKGLHYHLPVLFDYFHLSAVAITIHATLVALHQPYINTPRSAKPWLGGSKFRTHTINNTSMESVFQSGTKCGGSGTNKLAQARLLHQNVCEVLLEAHQNLQTAFKELLLLLPQWQQIQNSQHRNATQRLKKLCDSAKLMDLEEDFTAKANSDVAQLCAENIVQWQNFLTSVSGKAVVHQHLAKKHHALRVKRFAEAFFVVDNPRHSAAGCYDANYQNYLAISELARRSKYLVTLPPLPVHCVALDGDHTTMPIIFEDQYQDTLEFARRRSVAVGKKSGSDPFLAGSGKLSSAASPLGSQAAVAAAAASAVQDKDDCSCGIAAILESRSQSRAGVIGSSQVVHAGHTVQASLNITPHHKGHGHSQSQAHGPGTGLPARHSKSLDQLRVAGAGHFATMPTRSSHHHDPERKRRGEEGERNGCADDTGHGTLPGRHQQQNQNAGGRRRLPFASRSTVDLALHRGDPSPTAERSAPLGGGGGGGGGTAERRAGGGQRSPRKQHYEFHHAPSQPQHAHHAHPQHPPPRQHQPPPQPPPPRPLSEPQHSNTSAHPKHHHCRSSDESERRRRTDRERGRGRERERAGSAADCPTQVPRSNSTQIFPPNKQELDIIFHHSTLILSRNKERPTTPNYRSDPERRHRPPPHHHAAPHPHRPHHVEASTFPRHNQSRDRAAKCANPKLEYACTKNSSISNRYKLSGSREPILTSSSTDSESIPNGAASGATSGVSKRLHTSASVPHHLARGIDGLRHVRSASSVLDELFPLAATASESLPNLAQQGEADADEDAELVALAALGPRAILSLSTSGSTSSLTSERSGWVSSRTGSEISSPEPAPTDANTPTTPTVNGEQLRSKLYELVAGQQPKERVPGQPPSKHKPPAPPPGYGRTVTGASVQDTSDVRNGRDETGVQLTLLDDGKEFISDIYGYAAQHGTDDGRNNRLVKVQMEHPYIKKEIPHMSVSAASTPTAGAPPSAAVQDEADADGAKDGYEEVRLPPPKQFRDVPPPPEPFRDPSPGPSPAIDNLLYHVYETIQDDINKSHSANTTNTNTNTNTDLADKIEDFLATEEIQQQKLPTDEVQQLFKKARDEFKSQLNFSGMLYSDLSSFASNLPYFHISDEYRIFSPEGMHLIVCVHGLDGNSADLRLVKTYLELGLPGAHLEFLMSERNQGDTFSDFDTMTDRLVGEILYHMESCGMRPTRISFVGHSLGNIIIRSALTRPQMKPLLSRLHTFLSLSGPHLGTLYNSSGLVNMGMWFMQKWKKSGSLLQLCLRDATDVRQSFLYRLSQRSTLHHFKNVLLCGSSQDRYVPLHSARLELCKAAIRDTTALGSAYREMVHNVVSPMLARRELTLVRYDVHHALPHTANALIGRAAHIAVLDSELFIEKFLVVAGLKYFR